MRKKDYIDYVSIRGDIMPKPDTWDSYKDIPDFYNRVRSVVGANPDALTDTTLDYYEYAPYAEYYIKGRVTNWQELSDDMWHLFESCIIIKSSINVRQSTSTQNIKMQATPNLKLEFFESATDIYGLPLDKLLEEMIETLLGDDLYGMRAFVVT